MRVILRSVTALMLMAPMAGAQSAPAAKKPGSASATTGANPLSDSLRSQWKSVKTYYVKSADEMPEENYGFKPVDTVRTFGQIIAHVAGTNYVICSAAKGEKTPYAESYFEKNATTRDAIIKAASDSVAYCDAVFEAATDATLRRIVPSPFGSDRVPSSALLVMNIGHVNEHYGNLVTYLRIKGLVPPSSQSSGH